MAHPSGTYMVSCPYCGQRYTRTNWMRRDANTDCDDDGRRLIDTHLIACWQRHKAGNAARPVAHSDV